MKKSYLGFLIFAFSFSAFSQSTINLSFTVKDAVSHNVVAMDSMFIQNITRNCDTTLYESDSKLTVVAISTVGISENTAGSKVGLILNQNFPNPFQGSTTVSIYRDYDGPINLVLSDGLGRKLAEYQNEFDKGFHSFSISTSTCGILILTMSDNKNNKSIKIISAGQGKATDVIQYLGQIPYFEKSSYKSQESSDFIFFLGNQIQYTAYANGFYDKTIIDTPAKDTTYSVYMEPIGITQPAVTTSALKYISQTSVTCGGNITFDGGAEVTNRGVCWSTSLNPTTEDKTFDNGPGTGDYVSYITGLTPNTLYHFRAFATNSAGTSYGEDLPVTTLFPICNWYVPGDYVVASYPGTGYQNWNPLYSPMIQNTDASSLNVEGYVYMANSSNQWKITTEPDWSGAYYGPGAPGVLDPYNTGNFIYPDGYYKINVNPSTLTYTAVATSWGVIGSATAQGWLDETALAYNPEMQTWRGGIPMVPGLFGFRANHSWDFNYSSSAENSTLITNGQYISVDQNADYYVILDLSHPNAYTFSANTWGVLGSATNNGWYTDQNLSWDTTNQVLSTIIPLTIGEIKFRANDGWVTYLGGDINALAYGGANIPITEAGEYQVSLDLGKAIPSCTITRLVSLLPIVATTPVTTFGQTSITCGGNVSYDGGTNLTKRGVCWSVLPNPTIDDSLIENGYGRGIFVSYITGLIPNMTYYIRAYAINSTGISYGEEIEATTLYPICNWYIPGDYVVESYPGGNYGQWAPSVSPMIKNSTASPLNVEGYVYMANTSNQWKIATNPDWSGPTYGPGAPGILDPDPNGDNFDYPAGYYKINVNPSTLTYTTAATSWGVIGSATPQGEIDETPLTYYPDKQTWRGWVHLTVGEFKFRANHSWDFNYGSTAGNSILDSNGSGIPMSQEGDYYLILDLSHPNAYTWSFNSWGIIGSATTDGWNSDQNMNWDAINQVYTVTIPLTAGEIKFRANDGWAENLGGDINALTPNGANIPINEAGTYIITLDLGKVPASCTITKKTL